MKELQGNMLTRSERILEEVIGPSVLDLGCAGHVPDPSSPYWLHGKLRQRYPSLTGVDLNSDNVRELGKLGYQNLHVASAEDFDLKRKFDTIVAGELIEHLSNPGLFLERCRLHLREEGRLVITTPYAFSLMYLIYAFFRYPKTVQNDEHVAWFCPKTLTGLAARYGFEVQYWELIEDYEFNNASLLYRIFARFITTIGVVLVPARLRKNVMLFVLVPRRGAAAKPLQTGS